MVFGNYLGPAACLDWQCAIHSPTNKARTSNGRLRSTIVQGRAPGRHRSKRSSTDFPIASTATSLSWHTGEWAGSHVHTKSSFWSCVVLTDLGKWATDVCACTEGGREGGGGGMGATTTFDETFVLAVLCCGGGAAVRCCSANNSSMAAHKSQPGSRAPPRIGVTTCPSWRATSTGETSLAWLSSVSASCSCSRRMGASRTRSVCEYSTSTASVCFTCDSMSQSRRGWATVGARRSCPDRSTRRRRRRS